MALLLSAEEVILRKTLLRREFQYQMVWRTPPFFSK